MRNAKYLPSGLIVTTDNAAAIGEKALDIVQASDEVTAYFCTRTALLEQWAAGADPDLLLLQNFSGEASWARYVKGATRIFHEISCPVPAIQGSTETNMETLQSALAVTMIGHKKDASYENADLMWFTYGYPLVGNEVLEQGHLIADLRKIYEARKLGWIAKLWPIGSKGIATEYKSLTGHEITSTPLNAFKSAGPSTVIIIGVSKENQLAVESHFGTLLNPIR